MGNWASPIMPSNELGMLCERLTDDGRIAHVCPQLFNCLLGLSKVGSGRYLDSWEYPDIAHAVAALGAWDITSATEPPGWTRHPASGRRRPDGDASSEYVRQ